jgi:hypothetical protein
VNRGALLNPSSLQQEDYDMSIKARFPGRCRLCGKEWNVGDRIGRWLGHEAHFSCRQAETEKRIAAGEAKQLPEARGWADSSPWTKPRRGRRWKSADIGKISQQDGRSQDGRFQSKPDTY